MSFVQGVILSAANPVATGVGAALAPHVAEFLIPKADDDEPTDAEVAAALQTLRTPYQGPSTGAKLAAICGGVPAGIAAMKMAGF